MNIPHLRLVSDSVYQYVEIFMVCCCLGVLSQCMMFRLYFHSPQHLSKHKKLQYYFWIQCKHFIHTTLTHEISYCSAVQCSKPCFLSLRSWQLISVYTMSTMKCQKRRKESASARLACFFSYRDGGLDQVHYLDQGRSDIMMSYTIHGLVQV